MNISNHVSKLGYKVRDRVTGFTGIVETVSFDLYGCIQVVVQPEAEGGVEHKNSRWFDISRLEILSEDRVMNVPDFEQGWIADAGKGPALKPPK